MANIKGITIKIDGDTKSLQTALKDVEKSLKTTESELKQVNRALKFDPSNQSLMKQKQELLNHSIKETEEKLKAMKTAQSQATDEMRKNNPEEFRKLEREISKTANKLKGLKTQQSSVNFQMSKMGLYSARLKKAGSVR